LFAGSFAQRAPVARGEQAVRGVWVFQWKDVPIFCNLQDLQTFQIALHTSSSTFEVILGSVNGTSSCNIAPVVGAFLTSLGFVDPIVLPLSRVVQTRYTWTLTTQLNGTLPQDAGVAVNCTECSAAQNVVLPCGNAYSDWTAHQGFGTRMPIVAGGCPLQTPSVLYHDFCGDSPVRAQRAFFMTEVATFSTGDGSCDCQYTYDIEDFDRYTPGTLPPVPPCWSVVNPSLDRKRIVAASSNSPADPTYSVQWINANDKNVVVANITFPTVWSGQSDLISAPFVIFKDKISFFLHTYLEPTQGVALFYRVNDNVFLGNPNTWIEVTASPNSGFYLSCPPTGSLFGYNVWTGFANCTVVIDANQLATGGDYTIQFDWRLLGSSAAKRGETHNEAGRVLPTFPPVPVYPFRGYILDDIEGSGPYLQNYVLTR
jgi:hypothetical protein